MLDDFPRVKNKYFTIGLPQEKKDEKESKEKVNGDPRFVTCLQSSLPIWLVYQREWN